MSKRQLWVAIILPLCLWLLPLTGYAADIGLDTGNLETILGNLQNNFPAVMRMLFAMSYVLGIYFVMMSVFRLVQYGTRTVFNMAQMSLMGTISYLLIGSVLLFLPAMFQSSVESLWGVGSSQSLLAYPADIPPRFESILAPIFDLVRVIGLIAFIKGWAMLAKSGGGQGQPGQKGKSVMHIIGGVLALNIVGTLAVLQATFFG